MTADDIQTLIDKTGRLADAADAAATQSQVAAGELAAAKKAFEDDQTERRKFEKLGRTAIRVGGWVIGVLTVLVIVAVLLLNNLIQGRAQSRANQARTIEQTAEIQRLTTVLLDCTQPGGQCYGASQQRTAGAVKTINDAGARTLLIVATCRYKPTAEDFFSCLSAALPDLNIAGIPGAPAAAE